MTHSVLLFPYHCIPSLADLRGQQWQQLVQRVSVLPEDHDETLTLCLLVIDLCDCMNCDVNSYKASLGCRTCARRTLMAHKGTDLTLQRQFERIKSKLIAARAGNSAKPLLSEPRSAPKQSEADQEAEAPLKRRRTRKPAQESAD
jgi:hypothetical protein